MNFITFSIFFTVLLFLNEGMCNKIGDPFEFVEQLQKWGAMASSVVGPSSEGGCDAAPLHFADVLKNLQNYAIGILCDQKMGNILEDDEQNIDGKTTTSITDAPNATFLQKMANCRRAFCAQLANGTSFEGILKSTDLVDQMVNEAQNWSAVSPRLSEIGQQIGSASSTTDLFNGRNGQQMGTLIGHFTSALNTLPTLLQDAAKQQRHQRWQLSAAGRRRRRRDNAARFMQCLGAMLLISLSGACGIMLAVKLTQHLRGQHIYLYISMGDTMLVAGLIFSVSLFFISLKSIFDSCLSREMHFEGA